MQTQGRRERGADVRGGRGVYVGEEGEGYRHR